MTVEDLRQQLPITDAFGSILHDLARDLTDLLHAQLIAGLTLSFGRTRGFRCRVSGGSAWALSPDISQGKCPRGARDPDPGAHRLTPATAGSLDGSIVELVVLDHDRDGRDDLAAAVRTGTRGSIWIYLNRSPGDVAGP